MTIEAGLTGHAKLTVGDADTAIALGSGDVPVLGTPRIVALVEQACCNALEGRMNEGQTSVGTRIELDHIAPSRVGATVSASATLDSIDGRMLLFSAEVHDGDRVIARANHRRAQIGRQRFLGGQ